jgi:hypothetical protein
VCGISAAAYAAYAAVAVAAVGTAVTIDQQKAQGKYQKQVAEYNARVAENAAKDAARAGAEEENAQRLKTAQLLSRQRAQLGAGNIDLTSGSALQLQEDTVILGEVDALRIRSNFEKHADALNTGAALTRFGGDFARAASRQAATGTLLQGVSKTASTAIGSGVFSSSSSAPKTGTTPGGLV